MFPLIKINRISTTSSKCTYILLVVIILFCKCSCDETCNKNEKVTSECRTMETQLQPENNGLRSNENHNALAVVLYDENSVLPLHKSERVFNFANQELRIKQDWMGTGIAAVVWDSAEVLSHYLEQNVDLVNNKTVLELGAGTGLVGMVAALLGGIITITDRQEVLHIPEHIVQENLPPSVLERVKIKAFDWSKDLHKYTPTYDVILGADIIYIEEVFPALLQTLLKLSTKNTLILLSGRIRYERDSNFIGLLKEHFIVKKVLYNKEMDVILYRLSKISV